MSKRPSLTKQVCDALNQVACFGQSKYAAKIAYRQQQLAKGVTGWQPISLPGIYSIQTMATYRKAALEFTDWVKREYSCRYLADAKPYVSDYLQYRMGQAHSPWTLQMVRSALRKLYQDPLLAQEITLPIRAKSLIVRSRGVKMSDRAFSISRNQTLVDLCRATGLRRHEVAVLKAEDVFSQRGRLWVTVHQGKGGRKRCVPVLKNYEVWLGQKIAEQPPETLVIDRLPVRADIHGYRREYAAAYYRELTGNDYQPHSRNLIALGQVSAALGHNRIDVVTRNYLG